MILSRLAVLCSLAAAMGCGVDVDDVISHRQRWREAGVRNYAFVLHVGCFCDITDRDGVRHEVRDGSVVASVGVGTGLPLGQEARTIDDVFEEAIAAAREDPDVFRISYDETLHFVRSLNVDFDTGAEDDGYNLEVRCFSEDVENGCPVTMLSEAECADAGGTPTVVAVPNPWLTCNPEHAKPLGRISGSHQVCCEQ